MSLLRTVISQTGCSISPVKLGTSPDFESRMMGICLADFEARLSATFLRKSLEWHADENILLSAGLHLKFKCINNLLNMSLCNSFISTFSFDCLLTKEQLNKTELGIEN
jgi:hypothetical protein